MKKMKWVIGILLAISVMTVFSACGNNLEQKILGSWAPAGEDEYVTFYSNGTVTETLPYEANVEGTWRIEDGNHLVLAFGNNNTGEMEIVEISSDSMTWEANGNRVHLLKRSD